MSLGLAPRLAAAHAWASTLELLRHPGYVVPTLVFPAMFFLFFAAPAKGVDATVSMCSFAAFAVIGVGFFQFGIAAANDRISPWETYLRTLPVGPGTRFAARVAGAGVFAAASSAIVVLAAVATTPASLDAAGYSELALVLAAALVPFALLGIALGYWATPRGALPLANILYLSLSYLGGLWTGPGTLPHAVEHVSSYLPTRQYGEVLWNAVAGTFEPARWLVLAAYGVVFAAAAVQGYRRDEGQRFR